MYVFVELVVTKQYNIYLKYATTFFGKEKN